MNTPTKETLIQTLTSARALIAEPAHWCRRSPAKDMSGCDVAPTDTGAVSFCAIGALMRVLDLRDTTESQAYSECCRLLSDNVMANDPPSEVARYNDRWGCSHQDVLAMYDRAIWRATYYDANPYSQEDSDAK